MVAVRVRESLSERSVGWVIQMVLFWLETQKKNGQHKSVMKWRIVCKIRNKCSMTCYFKAKVNHRVYSVPNIQFKWAFFSPESCTTDDTEWKIHIKLQASNQWWTFFLCLQRNGQCPQPYNTYLSRRQYYSVLIVSETTTNSTLLLL